MTYVQLRNLSLHTVSADPYGQFEPDWVAASGYFEPSDAPKINVRGGGGGGGIAKRTTVSRSG